MSHCKVVLAMVFVLLLPGCLFEDGRLPDGFLEPTHATALDPPMEPGLVPVVGDLGDEDVFGPIKQNEHPWYNPERQPTGQIQMPGSTPASKPALLPAPPAKNYLMQDGLKIPGVKATGE